MSYVTFCEIMLANKQTSKQPIKASKNIMSLVIIIIIKEASASSQFLRQYRFKHCNQIVSYCSKPSVAAVLEQPGEQGR